MFDAIFPKPLKFRGKCIFHAVHYGVPRNRPAETLLFQKRNGVKQDVAAESISAFAFCSLGIFAKSSDFCLLKPISAKVSPSFV